MQCKRCSWVQRQCKERAKACLPVGWNLSWMFGAQNPYWYRAISSEPCYWQAKNMMKDLDAKAVNRFHSNPFWMQYTQCHNDW